MSRNEELLILLESHLTCIYTVKNLISRKIIYFSSRGVNSYNFAQKGL